MFFYCYELVYRIDDTVTMSIWHHLLLFKSIIIDIKYLAKRLDMFFFFSKLNFCKKKNDWIELILVASDDASTPEYNVKTS